MLRRRAGRTTEVAHVGGTHIPPLWLGRRLVGLGQPGGATSSTCRLDGIQRQTGPAPGARAGDALRPARAGRSRRSSSAPVLDHAIQEFGLVVSDEEVAGRDRTQSGPFRGTGGSFDPPALLPQPPAGGAGTDLRGRSTSPKMRREIAANQLFWRGCGPEGPRAQVAARRHLQDGKREAGSPRRSTCPTPLIVDVPKALGPSSSTPISRPTRPSSRSLSSAPSPMVPAERRGHPCPRCR